MERELTLGGWVGRFGEMYPHGKNGRELIADARGRGQAAPGDHGPHRGRGGRQVRQLRQLRRSTSASAGRAPETIQVARRLDRRRHRLRHLPAGGRRARLRHRRRRDAARVQGAARRRRRAARVPRAARPQHRLRLLRRQPPAGRRQRRQRVLLALLLHGRRPRLGPGVAASTRRSASSTSTATCGPTASTRRSTPSRARRAPSTCGSRTTSRPRWRRATDGRLVVTVRDLLTGGEELAIPADLVVLVTGMVPRKNEELVGVLKLPAGQRRLLQRDPPQAAPGRDRRRRRPTSPAPARDRRARPRASPPAWPP